MNHVSKAGMASLIAIFGLAVVGCDGSDGEDGQDSATTRIVDLAPGPVCASGGIQVGLGVDLNGDGELSDAEVTETKVVCNGEDGTNGNDGQDGVTTRIVELAPGPVCAAGGIEVGLGVDSNGDGTLSDEELTETKVVCNGEDGTDGVDGQDGADGQDGVDGQDGADGANGANSLVNLTAEPAGGNCEAGGYRLDTGLDNGDGGGIAGNALLEAGEVDATNYVCHGVDGFTVLTTLSPAVTANCSNGGQRLDIGLDNGDNSGIARDGTLQTGEIDSTGYICNGANGQDGTDGTDGADGTNGSDGADGSDGQDGQSTLVKQDTASSANCPDGGVTITSGLDNGDGGGTANNTVLESGEVDYTQHVCNGESGGGTQLVDSNGAVLGSVLGATLTEITLRTPNPYNYLVTIGWDGNFRDNHATYTGAGCTGDIHIYIDGTPNKSIPAKSAFWAGKEGQFLVPNGNDFIANQVLSYASYWDTGVCTDSTGSEDMWAASLFSATSIGLPATVTAPLSLQ